MKKAKRQPRQLETTIKKVDERLWNLTITLTPGLMMALRNALITYESPVAADLRDVLEHALQGQAPELYDMIK